MLSQSHALLHTGAVELADHGSIALLCMASGAASWFNGVGAGQVRGVRRASRSWST